MTTGPKSEPPKDRRASVPWKRVLLIFAVTWIGMMLAIYWIIHASKW